MLVVQEEMVDLLLWAETLLVVVLIAWWLEEFGIINIGLYVYLGLKPGKKKNNTDFDETSPVQVFTSYGYPLEIDTSKDGNDAISWNGREKFSGIHNNFKFLHEIHAARTVRWLKAQRACTWNYFSSHNELRKIILNKITEVSNYDQIIQPVKKGQHYFYYRRNESTQSFVFIKSSSMEDEGDVILDLNAPMFGAVVDSGFVSAFVDAWVSDDGISVAYGISYRDSKGPAMRIGVKNTLSNVTLSDTVSMCDVTGNVVWDPRGHGFFYSARGPASTSCVRYHKLGTTQDTDVLIFSKPFLDTSVNNLLKLSADGVILYVHVFKAEELSEITTCFSESAGNALFMIDVGKHVSDHASSSSSGATSASGITELSSTFTYRLEYLTSNNDFVWVRTNMDAPLFRIIKLNLSKAVFESVDVYRRVKDLSPMIVECISEDSEGALLEQASVADKNILVVQYQLHASHSVMLFRIPLDSSSSSSSVSSSFEAVPVAELPHSEFGNINHLSCSTHSTEIIYKFTSFTDPGSVFCARITRASPSVLDNSSSNSTSKQSAMVQRELTHIGIQLAPPLCVSLPGLHLGIEFETHQEHVTMPDGSSFPVFLMGPTSVFEERDARVMDPRPCLLCAAGAFGAPLLPQFSMLLALFLRQCGGLVCIANVPGGGEYGVAHFRAGAGKHKANAVDSFLRAAEFLIENEYTTQQQLGLFSGGAGGLLIGAAVNKRPWLFGAAVVMDGFFDARNHALFSPPPDASPGVMQPPGQLLVQPQCNRTTPPAASAAAAEAPLPSPRAEGTNSLYDRETGATQTEPASARGDGSASPAADGNVIEVVSPVHSVANRDIPYPAMLLIASNPKYIEETICASVVPPQHSMQFAAVLQHAVGTRGDQKKPLLLYMEEDDDFQRTTADALAFLLTNLNAQWVVS